MPPLPKWDLESYQACFQTHKYPLQCHTSTLYSATQVLSTVPHKCSLQCHTSTLYTQHSVIFNDHVNYNIRFYRLSAWYSLQCRTSTLYSATQVLSIVPRKHCLQCPTSTLNSATQVLSEVPHKYSLQCLSTV